MNRSLRRRQALLSTATLLGALAGYGSRTHAACVNTPMTTDWVCSGTGLMMQQNIPQDDANVSTLPMFSVNTTDTVGVNISANGALVYTDDNMSSLTGDQYGLNIQSMTDSAGNDSSVTVTTNGVISGAGNTGIRATVGGSGALSVTADGNVDGGSFGIFARGEVPSTDVTVTTGGGTKVASDLFWHKRADLWVGGRGGHRQR